MTLNYRQVFLGKRTELGIQTGLRLALKERDPHHVICCLLLQVRNINIGPVMGCMMLTAPSRPGSGPVGGVIPRAIARGANS